MKNTVLAIAFAVASMPFAFAGQAQPPAKSNTPAASTPAASAPATTNSTAAKVKKHSKKTPAKNTPASVSSTDKK